jgi:outer membrane protein, heavy metal efflux system
MGPRGIVLRLTALAALPAVACVTYQARPLEPDRMAAAYEARRLAGDDLRRCMESLGGGGAWPPAAWGLSELTAAAFCDSPDLASARAALATARAALVTAGARQEPALGITAEYQSNAGNGLSPWTVGPAIDVPLTTAGKREIRISQSRNLAEAARLDLMAAAWVVRSRVRGALVELQASGQAVTALRAEVAARGAVVHSLEVQRSAGAVAAPEVATARAELEAVQIELESARSGAAAARAALAAAVGVPAAALADVTIDSALAPVPGVPTTTGYRAVALQSRADVLAALARYEASQDDLRLAVAEQYPDLHLGPGFLWDQGATRWQLGLSLLLPLINRNRGPIGEAEARRSESAGRVEAIQAGVVAELDAAVAAVAAAAGRLASADALVAADRALVESARQALAAGETSRLDLLLAEAAVQRALRVRLEAWHEAQVAQGALEDALQRPLNGPPLPPVPVTAPAGEEVATR